MQGFRSTDDDIEHWNAESGAHWLARLLGHYKRSAWINPVPRGHWDHTQSLRLVRTMLEDRMFPLTLDGLNQMTVSLSR